MPTKLASGRTLCLSRDPIAENGGIKLYVYVENDPINAYDPDGLKLLREGVTIAIGYAKLVEFFYKSHTDPCSLDDREFHEETSRLMAKYGDPTTAKLLGELQEIVHGDGDKWWDKRSGPDSIGDREANRRGIERGLRGCLKNAESQTFYAKLHLPSLFLGYRS